MIEAEWGYLQRTNSPRYFYSFFSLLSVEFLLNILIFNEVELTVIGIKDKPHNEKVAATQFFQ